jgi:hypothetical protein
LHYAVTQLVRSKTAHTKCRTFKILSQVQATQLPQKIGVPNYEVALTLHVCPSQQQRHFANAGLAMSTMVTVKKYETTFHSNTPIAPALFSLASPCIMEPSLQPTLTLGAQMPVTHRGPIRVLSITLLLPTTSRELFKKKRVPRGATDQIRRTQSAFTTTDSVVSGPGLESHVQKKHQPPEKVHLQSLKNQMSLKHVHHTNRRPHSTRVRIQPCSTSPRYPIVC